MAAESFGPSSPCAACLLQKTQCRVRAEAAEAVVSRHRDGSSGTGAAVASAAVGPLPAFALRLTMADGSDGVGACSADSPCRRTTHPYVGIALQGTPLR